MDQQSCSFCAIAPDPALPFLHGPNDLRICVYCLAKAQKIIAFMKQSYTCSFCGQSHQGDSMTEGPGRIHICSDCIDTALATLRTHSPPPLPPLGNR